MVKVRENLVGKRFGYLQVVEQVDDYIAPNGKHCARWKCICDCGNETFALSHTLKHTHKKSCGCMHKGSMFKDGIFIKQYNDFVIRDDYVIFYTKKNEPFIVDIDDFYRVRQHCWYKNDNGYFVTTIKGKKKFLHRFIMGFPKGKKVDHIHGEKSKFDNRKGNLRIVTSSQNSINKKRLSTNKSGVTGVNWNRFINKWVARLKFQNQEIRLGSFENFEDAVRARKEAEKLYYKEYAYDYSQSLPINPT